MELRIGHLYAHFLNIYGDRGNIVTLAKRAQWRNIEPIVKPIGLGEEIDIDYSHEALDVGFNVSYLLDFLANVKAETIRWSIMPDANASALLTLPDDESFKYVVMPMRI